LLLSSPRHYLDKLADTTHPIYESNHEEERHAHQEPVAEFLRCVIGWLHGQGLSTSAAGIYQLEENRGV
jgi:hypothetical protein